jgi:acid phosphatase (class A)
LDKLLKTAVSDSKHFGAIAKDYFQRKRPYREDSRIQPLGQRDDECAYPSGHATRGILCAMILVQLDPGRAEKLLERGREIGWDRVIGGVHHPSDIVAGRVLGQAVARALMKSPAFQADLQEAKQEYEALKKANTRQPAAAALSNRE